MNPTACAGPNLSGVWLDEASLMSVDTFTVSIGRLREAGEQGWLTATFTPKGRQHWTYEVFATGRPDTAIFHARTADNPFLPSGFHDTVRAQYTSVLAAQELEGQFVDSGGTMFKRHWFTLVDSVPELNHKLRAWDLAATATDEKKARDPDYTAGVLLGKAQDGTTYILDVRRIRGTPQQVQALVKRTAESDGREVTVWIEQEPGSAGKSLIDHYRRHVLGNFAFYGQRSTGDKATRAQPLAAQAEGGTVKLLRGPWVKDFLDEVECFPLGSHDDQVDAATLAYLHLRDSRFAGEPFVAESHRPGRPIPPENLDELWLKMLDLDLDNPSEQDQHEDPPPFPFLAE